MPYNFFCNRANKVTRGARRARYFNNLQRVLTRNVRKRICMTALHSDILAHWTPRRLAGQSITDEIQLEYVALLRSLYENGIRFSIPKASDVIIGVDCQTILPTLPIICFTELKLANVHRHTSQYGSLGIGFRREFLMRWGANPVFYMQSKNQGIVNTNLAYLDEPDIKPSGLDVFLSYVKPMGEPYSDQYHFYEEMEWRLVAAKFHNRQWPERFEERDGDVWFRFESEDVVLLILPNETTRKLALKDPVLSETFKKHMPMMADTIDCGSF